MGKKPGKKLERILRELVDFGQGIMSRIEAMNASQVFVDPSEFAPLAQDSVNRYREGVKAYHALPRGHELRKQFSSVLLDGMLKTVSNEGNYQAALFRTIRMMQGSSVKIGHSCCMERIAEELATFFSGKGKISSGANVFKELPEGEKYRTREFDEVPAKRLDTEKPCSVQVYVGYLPGEEHGYAQLRIVIHPPAKIEGLEELVQKHGFVNGTCADETYLEWGVCQHDEAYKHIQKGEIPLNDHLECTCPPKQPGAVGLQDILALQHDDQEYAAVMSKQYELTDTAIEGMKAFAAAARGAPAKGWEGKTWYFVLPTPPAKYFVMHLKHAVRDTMRDLGDPQGVEWHDYAVGGGDATLVVVTCAYDKSLHGSIIVTPDKVPLHDIVREVEDAIGLRDPEHIKHIAAMKAPGEDWKRPSYLTI